MKNLQANRKETCERTLKTIANTRNHQQYNITAIFAVLKIRLSRVGVYVGAYNFLNLTYFLIQKDIGRR